MISKDTSILDLNSQKMMVIGMILTNPSIGWKVALWKLLMVVFEEEIAQEIIYGFHAGNIMGIISH